MPLTTLLLLGMQADPAAVLARLKATLAKPLSAEFTVTRKDQPGKAIGKLVIEKPNRMRFSAKWGVVDFESIWSEDRTLEFSRFMKVFYESGPYDRLYQPMSNFTALPDFTFPTVLLVGDPLVVYGAQAPTHAGKEKVGEVVCDRLKSQSWDAWVAPDGRLLKVRYDEPTQGGSVSVLMTFTAFKVIPPNPKAFYEPDVPVGLRPYGLPRDPLPLQPGTPFPDKGWMSGGSPVAIEAGKPFLAVFVASDCEVSARASGALNTLKGDLSVRVFSDDGKTPQELGGFAAIRDRAGRTLNRLYAPGTPLFLLVDKDRKIKKLWYGFESEREDAFVKEVRAALGS